MAPTERFIWPMAMITIWAIATSVLSDEADSRT